MIFVIIFLNERSLRFHSRSPGWLAEHSVWRKKAARHNESTRSGSAIYTLSNITFPNSPVWKINTVHLLPAWHKAPIGSRPNHLWSTSIVVFNWCADNRTACRPLTPRESNYEILTRLDILPFTSWTWQERWRTVATSQHKGRGISMCNTRMFHHYFIFMFAKYERLD